MRFHKHSIRCAFDIQNRSSFEQRYSAGMTKAYGWMLGVRCWEHWMSGAC